VALHSRKDLLARKQLANVVKLQDFIGSEHKAEGPAYLVVLDWESVRNILHNGQGKPINIG
jgi:hypothetical protein